jgi:uncharacterized membrane protein YbhN (UPF0104 family)
MYEKHHMCRMKKKHLNILVKLSVTILLLSWFLYNNDFSLIFSYLVKLSAFTLLIINLLSFSAVFLNSVKWSILLPGYNLSHLFRFNLIGQFYSMLLPGQLMGDIAKGYLLSRINKDTEQIMASIICSVSLFILLSRYPLAISPIN